MTNTYAPERRRSNRCCLQRAKTRPRRFHRYQHDCGATSDASHETAPSAFAKFQRKRAVWTFSRWYTSMVVPILGIHHRPSPMALRGNTISA
jgi:hypothetical protein